MDIAAGPDLSRRHTCRHRDAEPEAIHHYREAIRFDPNMVDAHENLAVLLARGDALDEAADQFLEALRLDKSLVVTRQNLKQLRQEAVARGRLDLVERIDRETRKAFAAPPMPAP